MRRIAVKKQKPVCITRVMKKYEVSIHREIEHRAVIEVDAENEDVAKQMALNIADNGNPYSNRWVEGDVTCETIKVKLSSDPPRKVKGS